MAWIQIIDDDHWCGEAIRCFLIDCAGDSRFDIKCVPQADDGRDIYIVDNEFDDGDHGVELVRSIRERNPDSTIILCTATQGRIDPVTAMNAGCNALIQKGCASGRQTMMAIVTRHINTRASCSPSFLTALGDIKSIIASWNVRMEQESKLLKSSQDPQAAPLHVADLVT